VIALVENNPRALQSNSAAVSRRFSDGNVPLNGEWKPRRIKQRPTVEDLREYLDYDPETGVLRWKKAPSNRAKVGAIISAVNSRGYVTIKFKNTTLQAHRVAFALHNGNWPNPCCDHIDGNRTNNRAKNLRECSLSANQHNARTPRNNTSGVKGVHRVGQSNRWRASVKLNGRAHVKHFRRLEDAAAWVKQTREQLHGEFARH
jgi:hypothetical protein